MEVGQIPRAVVGGVEASFKQQVFGEFLVMSWHSLYLITSIESKY